MPHATISNSFIIIGSVEESTPDKQMDRETDVQKF